MSRLIAKAPKPGAPIGIDLFAGAGGFSLGMHQAGFDVVAAVEWEPNAATTYMHNLAHPDCKILFASDVDRGRWEKYVAKSRVKHKGRSEGDWCAFAPAWMGSGARASQGWDGGCRAFMFGDVSKVTGRHLMDEAAVDHVNVVFGGPPCQGLSTSNSRACLEDPRNAMIWEYLRIVEEVDPDHFIIENVPPILTVAKGALFNAIAQIANDAGYDVVAQKVDACSYGVPQHRVRALIVGTKAGRPAYCYPMPTHWAIGRPVDADGWRQVDEDKPMQKRLPVQARFDRATRRWSFDGAEAHADQLRVEQRQQVQEEMFA